MVLLVHGCVHSGYNWFPQVGGARQAGEGGRGAELQGGARLWWRLAWQGGRRAPLHAPPRWRQRQYHTRGRQGPATGLR